MKMSLKKTDERYRENAIQIIRMRKKLERRDAAIESYKITLKAAHDRIRELTRAIHQ